jgi:hypothetical protein
MSKGDRAARYKLSFKPAWLGTETAKIVFKSPVTGDSFDYALTGVGEEPLAEADVQIKCKARETTMVRIASTYSNISAWPGLPA